MPVSDDKGQGRRIPVPEAPGVEPDSGQDPDGADVPGQGLAIAAESLYLANLLLAPGLAFLALAWLRVRHGQDSRELARAHVNQTFMASLWAGVLLVLVNLSIILLGGYQGVHTWVLVILYFTFVHSTLVLLGVVGLSKAMAGQVWRFPLIGGRLTPGHRGHG